MVLEGEDSTQILGGAAIGATAAVVHALIAGLIIAPVMWGSLFYHEGPGLAVAILGDIFLMIVVGAVLGSIGAFAALKTRTT